MRGRVALGLARIGDYGLSAPPVIFLLGLAVPALALLGEVLLIPCVVGLLVPHLATVLTPIFTTPEPCA